MTRSAEEQTHPSPDDGLAAQQRHAPQPEVRVMRPEDFDAHTAQTAGMRRFAAISSTLVGSHGIWAGYSVQEINLSPETVSEWVIIRNGQEAIVVNLEGKGFHHADFPGVEKIVFSLR